MVFNGSRVYHNFYVVHLYTLTITESLVLNEGNEFHHFAMRFDLSHVFLDGELFAAEQATLLALVDVKAGECVDEKVRPAVVIVSFNHDVCHRRRLLLLFLLEFDGALTEIIRVNQDVVIVT